MSSVSGQTRAEEVANSLIHGVGLLLALGGVSVLITFGSLYGNAWHIVSFSVYSATLLIVFVISTIYHAIRSDRHKRWLQIVDHSAIYLLIAGTYTPFTLVPLNGGWGWTIFGIEWGIAVAGITFKSIFGDRHDVISTGGYLVMGWLIVIALNPLMENLSTAGLVWLVLGGVSYTLGAVFYLWERIPFSHAIWHVFVLGGAICHYFAILFHVLYL